MNLSAIIPGMKFPKNSVLLTSIVVLVLISGCVQESGETGKMSFETLAKGHYSGHKSSGNLVINDPDTFTQVWNLTFAGRSPFTPVPETDFSNATVIAAFMGEFSTGGYSIEIKEMTGYPDKVIVSVERTSPEPGSPVTMALTQPYHIVKTEKITKPVVFEES